MNNKEKIIDLIDKINEEVTALFYLSEREKLKRSDTLDKIEMYLAHLSRLIYQNVDESQQLENLKKIILKEHIRVAVERGTECVNPYEATFGAIKSAIRAVNELTAKDLGIE